MSDAVAMTGGCLCGAVRYTLTAMPIAARQCWCRLCQYLGAGTATANLIVPSDRLDLSGPMTDYASTADSGTAMHRHFCPTCGTPIGGYAESRRHLYVLRIGTLDDPDAFPPSMTIWTDTAPHWAVIDPNLPMIGGQPAPPATPAPETA